MLSMALIAVVLSVLAARWKERDLARRREHALLAEIWQFKATKARYSVQILRLHQGHGHPCDLCRTLSRPIDEFIAEDEAKLREAEEQYESHSRLAGPAAMRERHNPLKPLQASVLS